MHRKAQLFLSTYVDDFKMAGKKESIGRTWATLGKKIALEGATALEDHVYLGCSQRPASVDEAQISAKKDLFQRITTARVDAEAGGRPHAGGCRHVGAYQPSTR